jgi:hypothetical protein
VLQAAAALLAVDGHLPAYRGQGEIMPSDAVLLTRDLALDLGRVGSCRCRWPLASPAPGHPATRIPSRPGEIALYLHPVFRDAAPALSRLDLDPTPTPVQLAGLAARLADAADRWRPILRHDPDRRWYARLLRTEEVEVWLLAWTPGQEVPGHDHGGAAGAFAVVDGVLVGAAR